ncbi:MAG: TlpA disulfide reductase family protein [Chthoniobacter sp.]|nr:TlpA disulfide reductase family protein [Chthoniobacter sp.]
MSPDGRRRVLRMLAAAGATLAAASRPGKPLRAAPALLDARALVETSPARAVPAVSLFDADGAGHPLTEFAGQGLVVNLWATWCPPCVRELPALAALARRLRPEGVRVLAAASDRGGAAAVAMFFARHHIEGLEIWLDPNGAAERAWGVRGIPTTLVLDRAGRERARAAGPVNWAAEGVVAEVRRLVGRG